MSEQPFFVPPGYELGARLGAGRTAVVYLAVEQARQRQVALKLPRAGVQRDPVLRRMFENEVHITLKLDHPCVVRAFAGRSTGDEAFLALEYCAGGTLDQRLLERGRMPLELATQVVHQVAMGLAHAHDAHVLHRDVKPANVFLDERGDAKLGDFGSGTFETEGAEERVGTAFYMAPELFEGKPTSVRSDVYSLGVLAYEVLTGERPFVGDTYEALMFAHLHSLPRDMRAVRPDIDRALAAVVAKALSRDPARRFSDLDAFLAAFREATGVTAPGRAGDAATARAGAHTIGRGGARRTADPGKADRAGDRDDRDGGTRRGWWPFGRRRR